MKSWRETVGMRRASLKNDLNSESITDLDDEGEKHMYASATIKLEENTIHAVLFSKSIKLSHKRLSSDLSVNFVL
jgi:hypothetical protein